MQKIPVIPQLERSRQKAAALASKNLTSTNQKSMRYLPPAQRNPTTTLETRTYSKPSLPSKIQNGFQTVLSGGNEGQDASPSPSSRSSDSSSESEVSDRWSHTITPSPPARKQRGLKNRVEVWQGRRKGGNRAPKIEPEGTKTWRSPSNSQERKPSDISHPSSTPQEMGLTSKDINGEDLDLQHLRGQFELCHIDESAPSPYQTPCTSQIESELESSCWSTKTEETAQLNDLIPGIGMSLKELFQPLLIGGRSRFFPSNLPEEEIKERHYEWLCKQWRINTEFYRNEALSNNGHLIV